MTTSYTNQNQNAWRLDLSADGTNYSQLFGITSMDPPGVKPGLKDASSYDNQGWGTKVITSYTWGLKIDAFTTVDSSGVMTPAVTILNNCVGQFRNKAQVYAQWGRTDGVTPVEAYSGVAYAGVEVGATKWDDVRSLKITLDGVGAVNILNALPASWSGTALPVIASASPASVGSGGLLTLTGSGFTGATATTTKIGGTAVTNAIVVSDSTMVIELPTGSAGATTIVVTTTAGASNAFPYTRAA